MAKQSGLPCALYAGGYDIGGDTQSFATTGGPALLDVTDITQPAVSRLGGERDGGLNWVSYHDTAAGAAHAALSPLPLTDVIATLLIGPIAIGCPAMSIVGKQIGYDPTRGTDASLTFALASQANAYAAEWGVALTPGRRVDSSATAASSSNSYDTGASAAFGAQMYVQLMAITGTSVTIAVYDSADNSSFAAVTSLTTGALTTPNQAARVAISNSATVRRYIAVQTTGTFSNADFVVQVTKNTIAGVVFQVTITGPHGEQRFRPAMPAALYKTFRIFAPLSTHWTTATCAEVDCPHYLNGWSVRVDHIGPELVHAARTSGRRFTERHVGPGETWLDFPAGQSCFQATEHRRRLEREERFLITGGDWRGNPRGERPVELASQSWTDTFGEHQDRLAERFEKG